MSYWREVRIREDNRIWNKGFKWGMLSGVGFMFGVIVVINWIVP